MEREPGSDPASLDDRTVEWFTARQDEASFRCLYREHTPRLYSLALRLTAGRAADAQEIVQEAWVRAVEGWGLYQGRSTVRTWLSGILVNCYREARRRAARGPRSLTDEEEAIPAGPRAVPGPSPRPADRIDVERALRRLPDGYREVLVLHDLDGYTHREIARLLGIEEGTSKSQLARARARLRDLLRGRGPVRQPRSPGEGRRP